MEFKGDMDMQFFIGAAIGAAIVCATAKTLACAKNKSFAGRIYAAIVGPWRPK